MKITDHDISLIKITGRPRRIDAGNGLYLLVSPTGAKNWRFDYRFDGQRKTLNIGVYPSVSIDEAMYECYKAHRALTKEIEPCKAEKSAKQISSRDGDIKSSSPKMRVVTMERESKELRPLAVLGLDKSEELIYRTLLGHHMATAEELAQVAGQSLSETQFVLQGLEVKGLATHFLDEPMRYIATSPEFAVEALATQRHADIERARAVIFDLRQHALSSNNSSEREHVVEVITSHAASNQIYAQLMESVESEIVAFQRAPTIFNYEPQEALSVRAHIRTISDASFLAVPTMWERLRNEAEQGQEVRAYPKLPIKLLIFDQRVGIIVNTDDPSSATMIVVHQCPLLDALYSLFELVWAQSTPVIFTVGEKIKTEEVQRRQCEATEKLIPMLTAGLSDKAIAHQAGMSYTTFTRRITELMRAHKARTRFQLGWNAAIEASANGSSKKKNRAAD